MIWWLIEIGKDTEGSGRGTILGIIPAFYLRIEKIYENPETG
jgi:hypothetical protein